MRVLLLIQTEGVERIGKGYARTDEKRVERMNEVEEALFHVIHRQRAEILDLKNRIEIMKGMIGTDCEVIKEDAERIKELESTVLNQGKLIAEMAEQAWK